MTDPYRHPGGRTCRKAMPLALLLFLPFTIRGVWRDRRNLKTIYGGK